MSLRALLAVSHDDDRFLLAGELRRHGYDVVEVIDARGLHAALGRALTWPLTQSIDLFVVDASLDGASPLHALSYARTRGIDVSAILLTDESDPRRTEADRLDLGLCSRTHALEALEHALLCAMDRHWDAVAA